MATTGNKDPGETDDLEKQPKKPKKKSRWKRRLRILLGLILKGPAFGKVLKLVSKTKSTM